MDNELLTLTVDLDDSNFNEKAESIENKIEQIKEKSKEFRPGEETANIPGYNQAINTRFDDWIDNLDHIASTARAIEKASTSQEKDLLGASYKRQVEVAKNTVKDLINSTSLAKDLTSSVEQNITESFEDGLKNVFMQLGSGLRSTATNVSKAMGKLSDQDIVSRFMGSSSYREIMKPIQAAHPGVFTDQRMEQYLTSQLPVYVPQSTRYAITGGSSVIFPKKADSFRGLFPTSFNKIPSTYIPSSEFNRKVGDITGENTPLTEEEIRKLQQIVETDRVAQDAAVKAGLYGKSEGGLYRNPNLIRGHINAMSGFVFADAVAGAVGERKYGIENPDDPKAWNKIERKAGNNALLDSGRRSAYMLHDSFGEWLNPGYYNGLQTFDPSWGTGIYTGPIILPPRRKSSAYAEYTLDMMNGGAQINGINPVVKDQNGNWRTISDVTSPSNKGKIHYSPSDFHTVTLTGSLEEDILSSIPGVRTVGHNEYNDNAIYLKYDPNWSNPSLNKGDRAKAQEALSKRLAEGYNANGHHYSFTRAGKTHAEFMRDDVIEAIGRYELGLDVSEPGDQKVFQAGLRLLANGADLEEYSDYKPFAKSLYNQNLLATEGENLRTLWGVPFGFAENETTKRMLAGENIGSAMRDKIMREYGTPNVKVAVGSFGTDMDGANWGSTRMFNEGGQGRSFGGKATYVRLDLNALKAQYPEQIRENEKTAEEIAKLGNNITPEQRNDILNKYGSFLIPGAGATGGDLLLDWDTDIVEDKKNIKNFDQMFGPNATQAEINDRRSRDVSRFGISMKTTYDKSNTSSRWLSRQLVNGPMNAGFSNPEVDAYFSQILLNEINRLSTDDQYVRRQLFGGDQDIDLNSDEAQNVIRGHISSMIDDYSSGDRLLPAGVYSWNMAAPNPINVVNNALRRAGVAVPETMQNMELEDKQVISMGSLFDQLGIVRHPATVSGNIVASNMVRDKKIGPKIQKMAEQLQIDPKALYFRPDSPVLKMLQGEDFDGDINGLFGLNGDGGEEFSHIMGKVFQISNDYNDTIWEMAGRTREDQEALKSSRTVKTIERKEKPFNLRSPEDVATYIMEQARNTPLMGKADRTMDMMALLQNPNIAPAAARAILDYESNYDIVSVHGKTGEEWDETPDQKIARSHGRSFNNLFRWIGKSLQTVYDDKSGHEIQVWNGSSQEAFNARNIDTLNYPTITNGSLTGQLLTRMYTQQQGLPGGGLNPDGTPKYDVDSIFANLPEIQNPTSALGRFIKTGRDIKRDIAAGRYLAPSQDQIAEMSQLAKAADLQIEQDVFNEGLTDANLYGAEVEKRRKNAGVLAWWDYLTESGLRPDTIESNGNIKSMVENVAKSMGVQVESLFGRPVQIPALEPPKQTSPKTLPVTPAIEQQKPQSVSTSHEKEPEIPVVENKTDTSKTFDSQNVLDRIASEHNDITPREEARALLKGVIQNKLIDSVLNLPKEDLQKAVDDGDFSSLLSIKGIGNKSAQKIVSALSGSRLVAETKTKPEVVKIEIPNMSEEIQKAEEQIQNQQSNKTQPSAQSSSEKYQGSSPDSGMIPLGAPSGGQPPVNPPSGGQPPVNPLSGNNPFESFIRQQAQAEFGQLFAQAQEFSNQLYGSIMRNEEVLKGTPQSILQFEKNDRFARAYEKKLQNFKNSARYDYLSDEQKTNVERLLDRDTGLVARAGRNFSDTSVVQAKNLFESISEQESKINGTYDAQIESLDKWDEKIKELTADHEKLLELSKNSKYSEGLRNQYKEDAEVIENNLDSIKEKRNSIEAEYRKQNQTGFQKQLDALDYSINPQNKIKQTSQKYQEQIQSIRENVTKKHNEGLLSDEDFDKDTTRLKALEEQASVSALATQNVINNVEQSLGRVMQRLGRQMFQKALTETKQFVLEFNKSMTSIQMITLKTDGQMSTLGDGLIDKAKDLKISISEISQSAEALYRQGLSDEEVNERLEVISKFSKVSGTKVDAATKLITVAMNTGLVSNSMTAADIVTALGDNAATNASEIEKGIEKAGAAAAADGTTFAELASMLTAITSTTQIGGNVAGRTLNTIFGRMNKIGTNELIYDENGNAVSGSAVAQLLSAQGVQTYTNGQKRSSYDVLYDLSQIWDSLSDAVQQQIANAIAGTRQYSNFAAIMQGMSEGKVDEYINLSAEANGITDQKYEIYTQSLEASLTNLRNTYNDLVSDLTDSGALTGIIDTFSRMIQGVDNLTNAFGGLGGTLAGVLPMLIAFTMLKTGSATGNIPLLLAGLGVGAVATIGLNAAGNAQTQETAQQRYDRITSANLQADKTLTSNIDRAKELQSLGKNRTAEDNEEYKNLLTNLAKTAGFEDLANVANTASSGVENLAKSAETLGNAASAASGSVEDYAKQIIKGAEAAEDNEKARQFYEGLNDISRIVGDTYKETRSTFDASEGITHLDNYLFGIDRTTGEVTVSSHAHEHLTESGYENVFALQGANDTVRQSFANVFSEALSAVDKTLFDVPDEYIGQDETFWKNFAGSRQDLPDVVLEAVASYWNQSTRRATRSSNIEQAVTEKLGEIFSGEEYDFIPQAYRDLLPSAILDVLPKNQTGEIQATDQNVIEAIYQITGLAGIEDSSQLRTADIVSNIEAFLSGKPSEEPLTGKVTYGNQVYDNIGLARSAKVNDFTAFSEANPIESLRWFGEAGYKIGEEDADYNAAREAERDKYINSEIESLVESSKKTEYINDDRVIAEENLANEFEAFSKAATIDETQTFAYTDAEGNRQLFSNYTDADKARYTAYQAQVIPQAIREASNAGVFSSLIDGANTNQNILDWWEKQTGRTYDDFAEMNPFEPVLQYTYGGQTYSTKSDAETAQMTDFWKQFNEQRDYYQINGLRYDSREQALQAARATLEYRWNKQHPIDQDEENFLYGGQSYETWADANEQRLKDFNEAADRAITAATETETEADDLFHAGAASGYSTWTTDKNNAYALRADQVIRGIRDAGVTDMDSLVSYIQSTNGVDWKYLTENNSEFARLVSSVQYNENGQVINPDVYNQIMNFLYTNGRDYTAPVTTAKEKATQARNMFSALTRGEGFMSWESALADAEKENQKNIDDYEASIQQRVAERAAAITGVVSPELLESFETEIREQNPYAGPSVEQIAAGYTVFTDEQKKSLQSILGEELYSKVVNGTLSKEETALSKILINNNRAGISMTANQRLRGMTQVRQSIANGTFGTEEGYSRTAADQYMSQWSNWNEYAALVEAKNNGQLYDTSRLEALEQELENLQEQATIEINVQGVESLEEAGKVIEGTTNLVKNLASSDPVKVAEALDQITKTARESGQQTAKLYTGTYSQINEAAMEILGMSEEEFLMDREGNVKRAKNRLALSRDAQANSFEKEWHAATTIEDANAVIEAARKAGFVISETPNNGMFTYDQSVLDLESATLYDIMRNARATANENGLQPLYEALAANGAYNTRSIGRTLGNYDAARLYENDPVLQAMLNLGASKEVRSDYINRMANGQTGTFSQNYGWALAALGGSENVTEWNAETIASRYSELINDKDLGAQWNALFNQIFQEMSGGGELQKYLTTNEGDFSSFVDAWSLAQAKGQSNTMGGAFKYAQIQYQQNNKAAIAADEIYKSLSTANINNITDLVESLGDPENARNWQDLISATPDLTKKLEQAGVTFDQTTGEWDVSALVDASGSAANALAVLAGIVSGTSESFKTEKPNTTGETYQMALDYWQGNVYDEERQRAALSEITGSSEMSQLIGYNWEQYNNGVAPYLSEWQSSVDLFDRNLPIGYSVGNDGIVYGLDRLPSSEYTGLRNDLLKTKPAFIPTYGANGSDARIMQSVMDYASLGGTGISEYETFAALNEIWNAAHATKIENGIVQGGIAQYRNGSILNTYDQALSQIEGGADWARAVESMQQAGLTLSGFDQDSAAYQEAIKKAGISVQEFTDLNEDMATQITSESVSAFRKFGKETNSVVDTYKKLNGTVSEQLEAQQKMTKNKINLSEGTYYTSGKGSKNYKTVAKKYLSYSNDDIKQMEKTIGKDQTKAQIEKEAELKFKFDQQQVVNDANAQIQDTIDDLGGAFDQSVFLGVFQPNMSYDISQLAEVAAEADEATRAVIAALLESVGNAEGHVTFEASADGNSVVVKSSDIHTPGGGSASGGGGGGGGGKSAAQTLVSDLGHEADQYKHDLTMLQSQGQHYDFINDYDKYYENLGKQYSQMQSMQTMYQSQIDQLQSQLSSTEYGSDDYWTIVDAINNAKEAMEDLTNQMDELATKVISAMEEKFSNKTTTETHKSTILEKRASKYEMLNDDASWESVKKQQNKQLKAENDVYRDQMREWALQMAQSTEGGEVWITARDKIYELSEKIAENENQILANDIEVNEAKVTNIGTDLQNAMRTEDYNATMYSTASTYYQSNQQYDKYRDVLREQSAAYSEQLEDYKTARQKQASAMDEIAKWEKKNGIVDHTDAWYSARDAVYAYDEAIMNLTNSIDENNRAVQQSLIQQKTKAYEDSKSDYEHIAKMQQIQAETYKENGDDEAYLTVLKEEAKTVETDIKKRQSNLNKLKLLKDTITDPTAWDEYEESIKTYEEEIAQKSLDLVKLEKQIRATRFENTMQDFNRQDALSQHEIKMTQYQETRYQNLGEWTNYGTALEYEKTQQQSRKTLIKNNLKVLRSQLKSAQKNDDETTYYNILQEIYKEEEAYEQVENTIKDIDEKLEQNAEKIRQIRETLENEIVKEIQARIQKEKNMLNAEVSMQNQLFEVIKKRYQDEWTLIKKDIKKRQDALSEQKRLINERLQAAKDAQNQEDKYEELAEYQRQLAMISMDPSRSKDVKELQRKIEELQKELSWEIADQEAQAAQDALDQQIDALSQYATEYEENLNELLSDANNFKKEMEDLLSFTASSEFDEGAFDRYMEYMKAENTTYKNSTEEARKQMEENWRQSWLTMQGLTETYWDSEDFQKAFKSKDSFLNYMKASDTYRDASDTGKESLIYKWTEMYENYTSSIKSTVDTSTFDNDHDLFEATATAAKEVSENIYKMNDLLKDNSKFNDEIIDLLKEIKDNNKRNYDTSFYDPNPYIIDWADGGLETFMLNLAQDYIEDMSKSKKTGEFGYSFLYNDIIFAEAGFKSADEAKKAAEKKVKEISDEIDAKLKSLVEKEKMRDDEYKEYASENKASMTAAKDSIKTTKDLKPAEQPAASATPSTDSPSTDSGDTDSPSGGTKTKHGYSFVYNGDTKSGSSYDWTKEKAKKEGQDKLDEVWRADYTKMVNEGIYPPTAGNIADSRKSAASTTFKYYKTGGLVDYTGPAWVDGTPSKPESFLSAYDTKAIQALTDALSYVYVDSGFIPDLSSISSGNNSFGDINIVINQAELKSDADYEEVARKVGQAFTRQMSRNGLNLSGYAF